VPTSEDELLQRLRATFRVEAQEHVQTIATGLVELERAAPSPSAATLDTVFRAAHSLKGAARAVNVAAVESLCQSLENVFAALKRSTLAPSAGLFDVLHRTLDLLARVLAALDGAGPVPPPGAVAELRRALFDAVSGQRPVAVVADEARVAQSPATPPAAAPAVSALRGSPPADASPSPVEVHAEPPVRALPDSVRVRKRILDLALLKAEELLHAKLATAQRAQALRELQRRPADWRARWARLRADVRTLESAFTASTNGASAATGSASGGDAPAAVQAWARVRSYLHENHDFTVALESDLLRQAQAAEQDQRAIGSMVDQLLDDMTQIVVQPFSTLLDLFPPSVRELARDQGKEVDLRITGADVEIDRRILDEIKDPLIHLVRNSIDHGIEPPAVRRQLGKPARGRLTIAVSPRDGSQVEVVVRDDGAGLDTEALARAAAKAGVLPAGAAGAAGGAGAAGAVDGPAVLPRDSLLALALEPGVSTSPLITDLSGRGLGLSIVKQQVERLNGALALASEPGQGASFTLLLPLTLARFRGVVVRCGGQAFVLPTRSVERVARIAADQVKTVENRETVSLGGRVLSLVRLSALLGLPPEDEAAAATALPVVVLQGSAGGQPIAFGVDQVQDEREVLVKPLGRQIERLRHIAGATVFGTGHVVPILHVPDLLTTAVSGNLAPHSAPAGLRSTAAAKSVLVAEDSITSRTLLRGILESAGYRVETAADGVDAFSTLRSGTFDIVVSDVDMPRLNGFGLTAKIRADKKLAELPVVLVTALDSREDREHGIDVGASAYIVKSSFDQGNLLEVVRRLA
jgi:two-component system chemotaxis sensor kinase CheA